MNYSQPYTYETKDTKKKSIVENEYEYSLKQNNFDPAKYSPNVFMNKLEQRMKQYYLSLQLDSDPFTL